jgi:SAM-dependent MidA family methyltransferase
VWSKHQEASREFLVYMVEKSPSMRSRQLKLLCKSTSIEQPDLSKSYDSKYSSNIKVNWLEDIADLPEKEAAQFFFANEFFDALPIQKFQVGNFKNSSILLKNFIMC